MKKTISNILFSFILLVPATVPVFAAKPLWVLNLKNLHDSVNGSTIAEQLKDTFKGKAARIVNGIVASTDPKTLSLTVTKDGKTYTVNTDSKTQFRRHFWGKSSFAEINTSDHVNVYGSWVDTGHTTILARLIRDTSIMKRRGTFFGNILTIVGNTFTMQTLGRGIVTVTVDKSTKLVNRREQPITFADLKVGQRIRVKGLWDKTLKTITEVTQVKDFSLPPQVKPSITLTPHPTEKE